MFDEIMGELLIPEPLPDGWREALGAIARRTREVWLRHPWMASSVGQRSSFGPNSMRHVEQSIAAIDGPRPRHPRVVPRARRRRRLHARLHDAAGPPAGRPRGRRAERRGVARGDGALLGGHDRHRRVPPPAGDRRQRLGARDRRPLRAGAWRGCSTGSRRATSGSLRRVASDRDLFANFERMRRELDALFGDLPGGGGRAGRRRVQPAGRRVLRRRPAARGRARRAGRDPDRRARAVRPRPRADPRRRAPPAGRRARSASTSSSRSSTAPFRRAIALGADVDATAAQASYEDGILTVELPIVGPIGSAPRRRGARAALDDRDHHPRHGGRGGRARGAARAARAAARSCRCATPSPSPTR